MATWKRLPQECEGEYFFDGRSVMTQGVARSLTPKEIAFIFADLMQAVEEYDGLDYLQVYECSDGRRVWCIDHLRRSVKECDEFTASQLEMYDYWTILLPTEY